MKITRRSFTALASSALATIAAPAWAVAEADPHDALGLQFYSFGALASGGWDRYVAAMAKARSIGYTSLELAGLGGYEPDPIRRQAAALGLALRSFHMGNDQVRAFFKPGPGGNTIRQAQDAVYTPLGVVEVCRLNLPLTRDLGCEWGVIAASGMSNFKSRETILRLCDAFNESNKMAQAMGLKLSYHMHATDFDIVDGKMAFEQLIENTDPAIRYQLDVCWALAGGVDPAKLIAQYPDRFVSFHLKDLNKEKKAVTPGDGVLDFKAIFAAAKSVKNPLFYVELESGGSSTFDAPLQAKRAYDYLHTIGWG